MLPTHEGNKNNDMNPKVGDQRKNRLRSDL